MVVYKEIKTDHPINKITRTDNLFKGTYTVDPYQNCEFACKYCDSSFEPTIYVKKNIVEQLEKKLKTIEKGRIIIGSVHDPYQPIEQKYKLTRKILNLIYDYGFSCNILTKSDMVLNDIDIISKIDDCMVTTSIISMNEKITKIFEPNIMPSTSRFKLVQNLKENYVSAGFGLIPILPYLVEDEFEKIIRNVKDVDADFFIFKHLELKGDQKQIFFELIKKFFPDFFEKYSNLYQDSYQPKQEYIDKISKQIKLLLEKNKIN